MKNQVVWATAESIRQPNNQRVRILEIETQDIIHVVMLGNDRATTISAKDICGFELSDELSTQFLSPMVKWKQMT